MKIMIIADEISSIRANTRDKKVYVDLSFKSTSDILDDMNKDDIAAYLSGRGYAVKFNGEDI